MSLMTWKEEFYPIPAHKCGKKNALKHSLRKWEGLLRKNLKKHDIDYSDIGAFIGATQCALCKWYREYPDDCRCCPIFISTDERCYSMSFEGGPYDMFVYHDDARPMVRLLRRLVKEEDK